jgi:hypothetical protein
MQVGHLRELGVLEECYEGSNLDEWLHLLSNVGTI